MKALLSLLAMSLILASTADAAVIKKLDENKSCTLFSMKHAKSGEKKINLDEGESVHLKGTIYGFTLREPKVDFDSREVSVRAEVLKFGLNRDLMKKVVLKEGTIDIDKALNQVNRKVATMDSVCINGEGELVYFTLPN